MTNIKFGTGGYRAIIGEDFTKENVQKICQAISNLIDRKNLKKEVCIGYDNRFMSEQFALWCAETFAGNNINFGEMISIFVFNEPSKINISGIICTAPITIRNTFINIFFALPFFEVSSTLVNTAIIFSPFSQKSF